MKNTRDILSLFRFSLLFAVSILFTTQSVWAIDSSYYTSLDGKSESTLRENLTTLLYNKHTTGLGYNWVFDGIDWDSNGNVYDIYSNCGHTKNDETGSYKCCCDAINREHVVPQSFFSSQYPQYADRHHLFVVDGKVNGQRGDYAFGECSGGKKASCSSSSTALPSEGTASCSNHELGKLGSSTFTDVSVSATVFEPDDEYKGDIARAIFYMVVRYATASVCKVTSGSGTSQNNYPVTSWNSTSNNCGIMFSGSLSTNYGLSAYGKALLLKWHREDPVSAKEIARNNGVEAKQGNRNPFVDYPCLVEYLWGTKAGQTFNTSNVIGSFESGFVTTGDGCDGCSTSCSGGGGGTTTNYTITWMVNGNTWATTTSSGSSVGTIPNAPTTNDCDGTKVFVGWTNAAINGSTNTKPTTLFTDASGAPPITGNVTFYAVFVTADISGTTSSTVKETFESQTAGTTYNSTQTYTAANSNAGIGWTIYYGSVSTSSKITGNNSAQMRWYSSATSEYGYAQTTTAISGLQSITFNAKAGNTNLKMSVWYSTDNSSWTALATNVTLTTSSQSYSYNINGSASTSYYIKIGVGSGGTAPSSGNYALTIDDVAFTSISGTINYSGYVTSCTACTPTNPTASFNNPTTSVYVGASVTNTVTTNSDGAVTYSSSNTSVATVDASTGQVTGVAAGTATITASIVASTCYNAKTATYTITVSAAPTYTVTWHVGNTTTPVVYNQGASLVLPTTPDDCEANVRVFKGWTATENYSNETTAPNDLFTTASGTVTANADYYAVYADKTAGTGTETITYNKVTSTSSIGNGDYLFVYETGNVAFNGALTTLDAASNTISVAISNNSIASSTTVDAAVFTIAAKSGGYSIKSASNKYIGHSGSSNALKTSDNDNYTNALSISSGNVTVTCNSYTLKYNNQSGQTRFRYFGSGQQDIQLYKKTVTVSGGTATTYSNYSTACSAAPTTYTITWKDGDGNTLKTEEVAVGSTPSYAGTTPTKTATAQYTYTFNNSWSPSIVSVTEPATYTAQFSSTLRQYNILWKNEDGTSTLETDANQNYGTATAFNGSTPTKAATAQYTYTFDGWATEANGAKVYNNGSTPTVSGTATYYAHFSSTVNSYSVTFKDNFGTTLKTQTVNYGGAATAPSIPEINCYTHGTWDKAYNNITGDLTVTVTYTIIPYTITATSDDDTQGTVAVTAL